LRTDWLLNDAPLGNSYRLSFTFTNRVSLEEHLFGIFSRRVILNAHTLDVLRALDVLGFYVVAAYHPMPPNLQNLLATCDFNAQTLDVLRALGVLGSMSSRQSFAIQVKIGTRVETIDVRCPRREGFAPCAVSHGIFAPIPTTPRTSRNAADAESFMACGTQSKRNL
jgi:hypothetical protein